MFRRLPLLLLAALLALLPLRASAQDAPAAAAEQIRTALIQAQLDLGTPAAAQQLSAASATYQAALAPALHTAAPEAEARSSAALQAAQAALSAQDQPGFAVARARLWGALLAGGALLSADAAARNDPTAARAWLQLREFRQASRAARPGADATVALQRLAAADLAPADAAAAIRADLYDTYQARLNAALADTLQAAQQGYATRRAETAALAEGYALILAGPYAQQRGADAGAAFGQTFTDLTAAALSGDQPKLAAAAAAAKHALEGFRAAPLSEQEQANRAAKVARYLSLIAPNYGRGVRDGQVTNQLEVEEARTFRDAALENLTDLLPLLPPAASAVRADLETLSAQIDALAAPETVKATADAAAQQFAAAVPPAWLQSDPSADFETIRSLLAQVQKASAARQYAQAESARLEAYAILDAGPEIRLRALDSAQAADLAGLFWQGAQGHSGLATLIAARAAPDALQATLTATDAALTKAQATVGSGRATPGAVITNAAVIIFRQGLEAVVILASLFAGLRKAQDAKFRKPLALGALFAGLASIGCWFALRALLNQFVQFGARLEATVSIVSTLVLLLILNWFFHNIYWVGWLSGIQKRKKRSLLSADTGQIVALALVGFTSVFREGFETALFSQVLVLEAGPQIVIWGLLLGALPVVLLGLLTFKFQAKLPYKLLLIISGVLIASVLVQMMGQTIHAMQVVRWMSVSPLTFVEVPYWLGVWFGLYPTWEGVIAQVLAAAIVFGSYLLAEHQQERKLNAATAAVRA